MALPTQLRDEIQKAIKTKDRLDEWIRSQNNRLEVSTIEPHWEKCKYCQQWDQPGWIWKEPYIRDNSDIHPSQIHKCMKNLWYSCAGYASFLEDTTDPRLRMIFDLGHLWHSVLQRYGSKGAWGDPIYYKSEASIDPNAQTFDKQFIHPIASQYWIKGHVDAVLDKYLIDSVPGIGTVSIRLIHEYKTINSNQYLKLTRPKSEHKYQAMIYAAVFDIPIVVYLYTSKDDCKTADFPVPFDHTIWNEIATKIVQVQNYVDSEKMPSWELTSAVKNPAECMDCGYRKICQPPLKQLGKSS